MDEVVKILLSVLTVLIPVLKKADSKVGIKESKEAIIGLNEVALVLATKFKDGVQFTDFTELYSELKDDTEFKAAVENAYEGYKSIPEEFKDIDAGESLELVAVQVEYVPKLKAALAKAE